MAQNWVIAATTACIVGALVWITIMGLQVGKWVHTLGGVLMLTIFAMIIALPWLNVANGTLAAFHPLQHGDAGDFATESQPARQDGIRRVRRIRVRRHSRRRVPRSR